MLTSWYLISAGRKLVLYSLWPYCVLGTDLAPATEKWMWHCSIYPKLITPPQLGAAIQQGLLGTPRREGLVVPGKGHRLSLQKYSSPKPLLTSGLPQHPLQLWKPSSPLHSPLHRASCLSITVIPSPQGRASGKGRKLSTPGSSPPPMTDGELIPQPLPPGMG